MKEIASQPSESLRLGMLLAAAGGFLESYTFFCRGEVFANCQTGNLILLALSLARGEWSGAWRYAVPVMAFLAGVLLTKRVRMALSGAARLHWRQLVLLFECFCLIICSFLPLGSCDATATTLVSFVCAMQVECFRKLRGMPYATTMCTGNLRSLSDRFFCWVRFGDRQAGLQSVRYLIVVMTFCGGVALGAAFTARFAEKAVLFCCLLLLGAVGLMSVRTGRQNAAAV